MRYAVLGLIIGTVVGAFTGELGAMIGLGVLGLALGIAFGVHKRDEREERERRDRTVRPAVTEDRFGIQEFLDRAERRGVIDRDVRDRLVDDLRGAAPSATPRLEPSERGSPTHRVKEAIPGRLHPDAPVEPVVSLPGGTSVRIHETAGPWALVSLIDGRTYWVETSQLVESGVPHAPAAEPPREPQVRQPIRAAPSAGRLNPCPVCDRPIAPGTLRCPFCRADVARAREARATPPPAEPIAPRPAPAPVPRPVPPSRLAVSMEQFGAAVGRAWKAFTADIAIHTLTYAGVLLLVVVMFVFFAFGFYGEMVSADEWRPWRPAVTLAIPIVLYSFAWMLRNRTGIPFTANAIGLVASLSLPIMLSALFQDGAPWGPPDVDGSARWIAYAVVGVVITIVYLVAARRATMYAYLVGPGIWTVIGALALYLEDGLGLIGKSGVSFGDFGDGISGVQMAAVVGAIAATVPIVSLFRRSDLGRAISVRVVRSAAAVLPVVAILAVAFAVGDARASGIARPRFEDVGPVAVATVALTGAALLWIRKSEFAWEDFGPRMRRWMPDVLAGGGQGALVVAWLMSIGVGLEPAWAGVGLVGYAAAVGLAGPALGVGERWAIWPARLTGVLGLALACVDVVPTVVAWGAVAALASVGEALPAFRSRWRAVINVEDPPHLNLLPVVIPLAVALSGVARLVPDAAASWAVAAGAVAMISYRLLPGPVLPLAAGLPAGVALVTAVGLEIGRTAVRAADTGEAQTTALGILLLVAAAAAWFLRMPARVRAPLVVVAATAGSTLLLRGIPSDPRVVDAGVPALVGVALCLTAGFARRSEWTAPADVLGHLAVYIAMIIAGIGGSRTAIVAALVAIVVVHGLGAWAADRGRSPLEGFPWPDSANAIAQGILAAAAAPVAAVVAADAYEAIRLERPRAGLVLAAVAWLYVAGLRFIDEKGLRGVLVVSTYAVGAAGIAVAAPSLTGSVIAVSSGAAAAGSVAWMTESPARSAPAWVLVVVALVLGWARAGVAQGDLHFVAFGAGVAMAVAPVVIGRRNHIESRWLHPPLAIGLLLLPVAIGFAIADRRLLALLALIAAGVYVVLGLLLRYGGFAVPAAVMTSIAYAHLMEGWHNPFHEPLAWMPLAALFAAGGGLLLGARFRNHQAGWGLLASWWSLAALAVVIGLRQGDLGWIVLANAGLLCALGAWRQSVFSWYAGLVLVPTAGALFGPGWLAAALAAVAVAVGVHATRRADRLAEIALAPASAALAGSAFGFLGVWQDWTPGEVVGLTAAAGATAAVVAAAGSLARLPGRAGMWVRPLQALGQLGLVVVAVMTIVRSADSSVAGWAGLSIGEARLTLAGVLGLEALLVGVVGTVRREPAAPWMAAGLAAGAYAMLGVWAEWTRGEAVGFLLVPGMVLAVLSAVMLIVSLPPRVDLWAWPLQGLAQAGFLAVTFVALQTLDASMNATGGLSVEEARLTLAGVLGFEALLVGVVGTVRREPAAPWLAAGLAAGAYAMLGVWAQWTPGQIVAASMLPGIVLAGASLALWRRSVSERLRMWLPALQGLGQGSLLVGGGVAAASFSPSTAAWTWGGLLAVEAGIVGAGAPLVPEDLRPRDASALLAAGAVLSAAGGVTQGPEQVAAVQTAAGLGALALFVVAPVERELPAWRMAPWVFGIVAVAGAVVLAAAALGPGDGGTVGTLAIGGAGLVAGGLGSGRWPAAYVGMLMLLVAGLVAGHDLLGGNRHLYAGAIAVVLLIILEMERIRMSRIDHPDAALRLDQTRVVELIVLAGPLALAALDSFGDPAFAGLLAGEAVIVLLWAIASRVKRRLVVGALGLVAAILIPAGVLAVEAASGGISSRAVLGIGALVAVALIAIGSMLERGRARVGRVVQRMSEILEDWE